MKQKHYGTEEEVERSKMFIMNKVNLLFERIPAAHSHTS